MGSEGAPLCPIRRAPIETEGERIEEWRDRVQRLRVPWVQFFVDASRCAHPGIGEESSFVPNPCPRADVTACGPELPLRPQFAE